MLLRVGTGFDRPEQEAGLLAERFNRHTFWCGQSGSGKTYALGVLLEQLLLRTELPIVILDPNADFTRLAETRAGADPADAEAIAGLGIRVLHSTSAEGEQLRTRFVDLSPASKAAVLRLDPIADAEEYNVLLNATSHTQLEEFDDQAFLDSLRTSDDPGQHRLALRIENLQVLQWELWSRGGSSAADTVHERPRATVLDLGGFAHPAEPKVAALAVLERLWETRAERRPVLIVIDEAHNLCPPDPGSAVEQAVTQFIALIAAEGRKFGLWLLLSSQRPSKIHPQVLSQCDNLGLMRMNAPRDLAELASMFGFVPEALLAGAQQFRQGQALFAGGFVAEPTIVQMGARVTEEGGADVRVPLSAAPGDGAVGGAAG